MNAGVRHIAERHVRFTGVRQAVGPLTWPQRGMFHLIQDFESDDAQFNIGWRQAVPEGREVSDVCAAVKWAMESFESLRTHYITDPFHGPRQSVVRSGTLPVDLIEPDGSSDSAKVFPAWFGARFDHAADLPIRCAIHVRDGRPVHLIVEVSHLSIDLQGRFILQRELARRMEGATDGGAERLQPLDLARFEESAEGAAGNTRALTYLRSVLNAHRAPIFETTEHRITGPRIPRVRMTSPAVGVAISRLAQRHKATTSQLYLACMALIVGAWSGQRECVFSAVSANRWISGGNGYVGSLTQLALVAVGGIGEELPALLRNAQVASMRAYRNAHYDAHAYREFGYDETSANLVDCAFNNRQDSNAVIGEPLLTESSFRMLRRRTLIDEIKPYREGLAKIRQNVHLLVLSPPEKPVLILSADRAALPGVDLFRTLRCLEGFLINAAQGELDTKDFLASVRGGLSVR